MDAFRFKLFLYVGTDFRRYINSCMTHIIMGFIGLHIKITARFVTIQRFASLTSCKS